MSGIATAVIGSAVIGGVVASNSASKANSTAKELSADQMAFEQRKLDEWNDVYGPIQDNLGDYYNNLTANYYETVGLENFAQEQQTAMTRLNESLAQRGIDPASGIQASLTAQSELEGAEGRASIRRDAPRAVAEDKSRFLQIGLGQNPGNSMSSTLAQNSNAAQQRATASEQAAGQAIGSAVSTVGTALVDYLGSPATPAPATTGTYNNAPVGPI
tara:strand:- start:2893 stop:3540 length:648 start_codon:yes stop_codon:yes gene_type:complete